MATVWLHSGTAQIRTPLNVNTPHAPTVCRLGTATLCRRPCCRGSTALESFPFPDVEVLPDEPPRCLLHPSRVVPRMSWLAARPPAAPETPAIAPERLVAAASRLASHGFQYCRSDLQATSSTLNITPFWHRCKPFLSLFRLYLQPTENARLTGGAAQIFRNFMQALDRPRLALWGEAATPFILQHLRPRQSHNSLTPAGVVNSAISMPCWVLAGGLPTNWQYAVIA